MPSHPHPTATYVERKHVSYDRSWVPAFSRRLPVIVESETAPITAVPYSAFFGVGRDPQHSTPHMWRYQALAIADKLSIAAPLGTNKVIKSIGALVANSGPNRSRPGGQNPVQDRVSILSPGNESLSSKASFYPPATYAPQYAKIM